jgi:PEP-CTERM motif
MRRLLLAGLLVFGTAHFAFGAVDWELEITDGTNSALINAVGALVLTGSASGIGIVSPGNYSYNGSVGAYTVNVTTGIGSPVFPLGALDLNSIEVSGSPTGPLTIEWSENGVTAPLTTWDMAFGGTLSLGTLKSLTNTDYESNTNNFFATDNTIGTITPTWTKTSFSGTATGSAPASGTYSLTEVITLNSSGLTAFSGDASLTPDPVPEPASMVLLGSVISVTVIALRRRKLMKKALVD